MAKKFDYPYTCPQIDSNISDFQEKLRDFLFDMIEELNPMFNSTTKSYEYRTSCEKAIYDFAESIFEDTRKANDDMRKEAEHKIESLLDELEEASRLALDWEREADELKSQIESLESEIEGLKEIYETNQ